MKNLVIMFIVTSLMIACGDSKSKSKNTVAKSPNGGIHGVHHGNTNGICGQLLPFVLADQHPLYRPNMRYRDINRFYGPNGEMYRYDGDKVFTSYNGGARISCNRLNAIDRLRSIPETCYQYELQRGSNRYLQNAINSRTNVSYPADISYDGNSFRIYPNNQPMICPTSSLYYDQYFAINGHVQLRTGVTINGTWHGPGVHSTNSLENFLGFALGAALVYNIDKAFRK